MAKDAPVFHFVLPIIFGNVTYERKNDYKSDRENQKSHLALGIFPNVVHRKTSDLTKRALKRATIKTIRLGR